MVFGASGRVLSGVEGGVLSFGGIVVRMAAGGGRRVCIKWPCGVLAKVLMWGCVV